MAYTLKKDYYNAIRNLKSARNAGLEKAKTALRKVEFLKNK